jgi:hypothetical protein
MTNQKPSLAKWKLYTLLVAVIALGTLAFNSATAYVAYPTVEHRKVGQEIARLEAKSFSEDGNRDKIVNSQEYKDLTGSKENIYTTRMSIGSAVLSTIISVAIVVALYRYLRRNRITSKPVSVTVLLDTAAVALITIPSIYIGEWITGVRIESLTLVLVLVSIPFAIGLNALIAFAIAKVAEWHYNRSYGFTEE